MPRKRIKIHRYIKDLLERAEYEYDRTTANENFAAGYTIRIHKYAAQQNVKTLADEVSRLCRWANNYVKDTAFILYMPPKTHYEDQYAIVTIFDPVMQQIEHLLPGNTAA